MNYNDIENIKARIERILYSYGLYTVVKTDLKDAFTTVDINGTNEFVLNVNMDFAERIWKDARKNPKFYDLQLDEVITGLFIHELSHITKGHFDKKWDDLKNEFTPNAINIAMDIEINDENNFKIPGGCFPEAFNFPCGLNADEYLVLIKEQQQQQQQQQQQGDKSENTDDNSPDEENNSSDNNNSGNNNPDDNPDENPNNNSSENTDDNSPDGENNSSTSSKGIGDDDTENTDTATKNLIELLNNNNSTIKEELEKMKQDPNYVPRRIVKDGHKINNHIKDEDRTSNMINMLNKKLKNKSLKEEDVENMKSTILRIIDNFNTGYTDYIESYQAFNPRNTEGCDVIYPGYLPDEDMASDNLNMCNIPRILFDKSGSMNDIYHYIFELFHWMRRNLTNAEIAFYDTRLKTKWINIRDEFDRVLNNFIPDFGTDLNNAVNSIKGSPMEIHSNDCIIVITDGCDDNYDLFLERYPKAVIFLIKQDGSIKRFGADVK